MRIFRKAEKRILCIPVKNSGTSCSIRISHNGDFLNLSLIPAGPEDWDFVAEYPLPFPVEGTVIEAEEDFFHFLSWRDTAENLSCCAAVEPFRQQFHLTPLRGWMNDPNGLYFLDGEWHVFFQYNPFASHWGNMHWNHAVSSDLSHWRESGIALFPDSEGMIFSGSAIIDRTNATGFGKDAVLLFYTNTQYENRISTQNLAYSIDGGKIFRKYEQNPLITNLSGFCDRDPHVAFDPDAGCWRMCLYLGNEERKEFVLFCSDDLLHWEKTVLYQIPGGRECPGIRRMRDEASGEWKWVFIEANGFYRTGRISRGGQITFECGSRRFLYGDAYAGQFFHGTTENETILLAWLRMPGGACRTFSGCMTLPMTLHLRNGELLVFPCEGIAQGIPFASAHALALRGPGKEILLDVRNRRLQVGGIESALPLEFPEQLRGHLYADRVSMEYFDDSGKFAAAFFLPGAEHAIISQDI